MGTHKAIANLALAAAGALLSGPAEAVLLGRDLDGTAATFEAYYDDVLDVTWLRDANLARSQTFGVAGIDAEGGMSFPVAQAWIAAMNAAGYLGYDDWRLPGVGPIDGADFEYVNRADGTTDVGYGISAPGTAYAGSTQSELPHLFYNTLGNQGAFSGPLYEATGCYVGPIWCLTNQGPFAFGNLNVPGGGYYWTGTPVTDPLFPGRVHTFGADSGFQGIDPSDLSNLWAWPVRDGDVLPAPEPASVLLLAAGLAGLAVGGRRSAVPQAKPSCTSSEPAST